MINRTVYRARRSGSRWVDDSLIPLVRLLFLHVLLVPPQTLMDVIAGRKTTGIVEHDSNIFVNGKPKDPKTFASITGCQYLDAHSNRNKEYADKRARMSKRAVLSLGAPFGFFFFVCSCLFHLLSALFGTLTDVEQTDM